MAALPLSKVARPRGLSALRAAIEGQGWRSLFFGARLTGLTVYVRGIPWCLGRAWVEPDRDESVCMLRPIAFVVKNVLVWRWRAITWMWCAGFIDVNEGERVSWRKLRLRWWKVWMRRYMRLRR